MDKKNKQYRNQDIGTLLEEEKEKHLKTRIKLATRERELHDITTSTSFKIARIIAKTKHFILLPITSVLTFHPRTRYKITRNKKYIKRVYGAADFNEPFSKEKTADTAVVLHLYYVDMLDYFLEKLDAMRNFDYDLFITLPDIRAEHLSEIQERCPKARVVIVPNCGRDVLPFVEVVRNVYKKGYKKVLKIHSKRSPHRKDGQEWRDKMINNLMPQNKETLTKVRKLLDEQSTSIIGPKGEYVSLLVNYDATNHHLTRIISLIYGEKQAREIKPTADEFGFFAGTMFWARIDAIMPVVNTVNPVDFEPELGQVDSTLAHALERLFCLVPELNNQRIFEIGDGRVAEIDKHTSNIPEWSEVALKSEL